MLLNKHNLAIAELASKKESRYTLQAIRVNQQNTAVTNGHYLVTVTLPDMKDCNFPAVEGFTPSNGSTPEFLLDAVSAKQIAKSIPKSKTIPVLNHAQVGKETETNLSFAVTDIDHPQIFSPRKVEGKFPNIESVIPNSEAAKLTIGVEAEYLIMLAKSALATCNDGRGVCIKMEFIDNQSAIKMTAKNPDTQQEWTGVLMPRRL